MYHGNLTDEPLRWRMRHLLSIRYYPSTLTSPSLLPFSDNSISMAFVDLPRERTRDATFMSGSSVASERFVMEWVDKKSKEPKSDEHCNQEWNPICIDYPFCHGNKTIPKVESSILPSRLKTFMAQFWLLKSNLQQHQSCQQCPLMKRKFLSLLWRQTRKQEMYYSSKANHFTTLIVTRLYLENLNGTLYFSLLKLFSTLFPWIVTVTSLKNLTKWAHSSPFDDATRLHSFVFTPNVSVLHHFHVLSPRERRSDRSKHRSASIHTRVLVYDWVFIPSWECKCTRFVHTPYPSFHL